MEYRAKLSQIYFSKYLLLEIGFEIDNTPHGIANKRILEHVKSWMEENKSLIAYFDSEKHTIT